jgi:hypothetical protein
MKDNKRVYTAPAMERIPVAPGSVMAVVSSNITTGSINLPPASAGGNFPPLPIEGSARATLRELDAMINDITVGQ